jgi:hypothetical protein
MGLITYEMLQNVTMTMSQCKEVVGLKAGESIISSGEFIVVVTLGVILGALLITLYWGLQIHKLVTFIRDTKLEKKYQEWKQNNKGLMM